MSGPTLAVDPDATTPQPVDEAVAVLMPTKGSKVSGTIRFIHSEDGIEVRANLKGLSKGAYSFQVHMYGDCSAPDASSAGETFNLTTTGASGASDQSANETTTGSGTSSSGGTATGGTTSGGTTSTTPGDLGTMTPKADGTVAYTTKIPQASLQGSHTLVGRSVVIHQNASTTTRTTTTPGKRLACGVIGIASDMSTTSTTGSEP
jgi:Cu-Zn family superoxide dismutase